MIEESLKMLLERNRQELPLFEDGRIDYTSASHAPVVVIFIQCGREFLLVKRSQKVGAYQGYWHTVAGYLDRPVSIKEQVFTELEEEISLDPLLITYYREGEPYIQEDKEKTWVVYPVLVRLAEKPPIILDFEHTAYAWVTKTRISDYQVLPSLLTSLKTVAPDFLPYMPAPQGFWPPNPGMPRIVATIEEALAGFDPNLSLEHIGSTAIPGMPGKNSINMLLPVEANLFSYALSILDEAGFSSHPYKEEPADRPLRVANIVVDGIEHPIHLHMVEKDSLNHSNALYFRDYLIAHPKIASRYAALKKELHEQGKSPEEYNQAKQPFIRDILAKRPNP